MSIHKNAGLMRSASADAAARPRADHRPAPQTPHRPARSLGVSTATVSRVLKSAGLPVNGDGTQLCCRQTDWEARGSVCLSS